MQKNGFVSLFVGGKLATMTELKRRLFGALRVQKGNLIIFKAKSRQNKQFFLHAIF